MQDPKPQLEASTPEIAAPAPREAGKRSRWPWVVGIGVLAVVAVLLLVRSGHRQKAQAQAAKAKAAARTVPVAGLPARTGDLGVYLTGLGSVTAINTVTVRTRVDGQLIKVAFREGQLVRGGELLAQVDPRPFQVQLIQAEGQRGKDEAALKNARLDLERYRILVQQDSIPRQQMDTQAALVNQLEATLKTDQGQIESAKLNLTYSRITAPISGTVGLRLVDPGNIVHAADPNGIVVITEVQPIAVLFTIPADRLPQVMQQLRAGRALTVEAYDRDMKKKLAQGSLLAVDNQIDAGTGTVRLKAIFDNADYSLYSNQFVNARLLVDTVRGAVLIPTAAIQRGPQSTYVYVVGRNGTVDMRNVDVQLTEGDDTAIKKGVAAGEILVVDGVDKLQPGTKVALASSSPRGPGSSKAPNSPRASRKPAS
ncbi:MAG: multidrug transporter subunit MdtA [Acidobacteria bacterium]|nr:MAG: multidrug transporter subunit MdtA [Acidobacteriota bacterium]